MFFCVLVNLSTVGQEDSSSEELEKATQGKPTVPPRIRMSMVENGPVGGGSSRRYQINKEKTNKSKLSKQVTMS